ncbi:MAG: DUF333 domain-containing protein [Methanomicrobiales archaeon]
MGLLIVARRHVTGCTRLAAPASATHAVTEAPAMDGIANHTLVNCGKIGGKIETRNDTQGNEYGMCIFTYDTSCDEWALFRSE